MDEGRAALQTGTSDMELATTMPPPGFFPLFLYKEIEKKKATYFTEVFGYALSADAQSHLPELSAYAFVKLYPAILPALR